MRQLLEAKEDSVVSLGGGEVELPVGSKNISDRTSNRTINM